jgi:hypothetical protein
MGTEIDMPVKKKRRKETAKEKEILDKIISDLVMAPLPANPAPPERLTKLGDIYKERNAAYGDTYKNFGFLAQSMFQGSDIVLSSVEDFNRMFILFHMADKLFRYASTFSSGGHQDSLDDLAVYAQMLAEYDEQCRSV